MGIRPQPGATMWPQTPPGCPLEGGPLGGTGGCGTLNSISTLLVESSCGIWAHAVSPGFPTPSPKPQRRPNLPHSGATDALWPHGGSLLLLPSFKPPRPCRERLGDQVEAFFWPLFCFTAPFVTTGMSFPTRNFLFLTHSLSFFS